MSVAKRKFLRRMDEGMKEFEKKNKEVEVYKI